MAAFFRSGRCDRRKFGDSGRLAAVLLNFASALAVADSLVRQLQDLRSASDFDALSHASLVPDLHNCWPGLRLKM